MQINRKKTRILNDWNALKNIIENTIKVNEDVNKVLLELEKVCHFAYSYNFLDDFKDDEIDNFLNIIANNKEIRGRISTNNQFGSNKIVFYDYFSWENRGFTQQYLDVLFELNYEILYISHLEKSSSKSNKIIQDLEKYGNANILFVEEQNTKEIIIKICNEVIKFNPVSVLFQNAPWDVKSVVISNILKSSGIKTFLLNITDHAFWPGANSFDKIIEFREYGAFITNKFRKRSLDDIIIIPTPPYISNNNFKGFNLDLTNKVIGYSGGNVYKILDKEFTFLNLMKEIIDQNEDFILLLSIIGDQSKVVDFINLNKLNNKIYLIGDRKDIAQVFQNIDIYFNTYPYGGGLMLQYASFYKKPIVSLYDRDLIFTRVDCALNLSYNQEIMILNKSEYISKVSKLISDNLYREYFGLILFKNHLSKNFKQLSKSFFFGECLKYEALLENNFHVNHQEIFKFHLESNRLIGNRPLFDLYRIIRDKKGYSSFKIKIRFILTKILNKIFVKRFSSLSHKAFSLLTSFSVLIIK
jgi:hypothetical protein